MNQGFTLIELLVVVLIIGILSAVALPQYQTAVERSRATEALTQMAAVSDALQRYHSQHETFPADNAFNKLDVEIPIVSSSNEGNTYGGKNFTLKFTTNSPSKVTIEASRSRTSHSYKLTTVVEENSTNGTYSTTRTCAVVTANDEEAQSYCNAIAGGADKAASGF